MLIAKIEITSPVQPKQHIGRSLVFRDLDPPISTQLPCLYQIKPNKSTKNMEKLDHDNAWYAFVTTTVHEATFAVRWKR